MNPQIIGLIGFIAALFWLPTLTLAGVYLFRRLQMEERLRAIEKGVETAFDPEANSASTRRTGIILIAAGIGIAAAVVIVRIVSGDPQALVCLALAVVPIAVGLGFLVDYRIGIRQSRSAR